MKRFKIVAVVLSSVVFATLCRSQGLTLQPMTGFGPNANGSILPNQVDAGTGVTDFTDAGYYAERSAAYNPMTGHVIFVTRTNYVDLYYPHAYILDGMTGTNISIDGVTPAELDLTDTQVTGGNPSFPFNMIGIADDGAIYIADLSNGQVPPQYRLYRWAAEGDQAVGNLVYFGDPGNGNPSPLNERWGDSMAVRGSGTNTQVLISSRGVLAAILTPTDSSMATFTATTLNTDIPITVGMGYGLCFGAGNTFYSKAASSAGLPLVLLNFNLNAGTATTLRTFSLSEFPGRSGVIGYIAASNLLVDIENTPNPNLVRLFDVSNPTNTPVFLDRESFDTNHANNDYAGSVAFGANGTVYALASENGLMGFQMTYEATNSLAPAIYLQPTNQSVYVLTDTTASNVTMVVAADGTAPLTYQWRTGTNAIADATNSSFTTNLMGTANAPTFSVVVSNAFGSVTSSVATITLTTQLPVSLPWYEPFNYAAGTLPTNGGWYAQSGTLGKIAAGSLNVRGAPASVGNEFNWPASSMSDRLPFGIVTTGTIYYSIALKLTTLAGLTSFPGVLCGFANGTGTTFVKLDVITNGNGGFYFGPSVSSAAPVYDTVDSLSLGTTVFVVQSYTFTGTGNDYSSLWINPPPSTFGAANAPSNLVSATSFNNVPALDRFFFRFSGGNQPSSGVFADELRMGTTWASVTPIGPPPLQITPNGSNIILSWTTDASNFSLQRATSLNPPIAWNTVTNAVTTSGTNYQVSVAAGAANQYFRLENSGNN